MTECVLYIMRCQGLGHLFMLGTVFLFSRLYLLHSVDDRVCVIHFEVSRSWASFYVGYYSVIREIYLPAVLSGITFQ